MNKVLLVAMLVLAGCATQAAVVDLETDKAVIRATGNDRAIINRTARNACRVHGKKAKAISYSCLDSYCITVDYLYACT